MSSEHIHSRTDGLNPFEKNEGKGIGTGTPLKDDSVTPLSTSEEKHQQVVGIGPGTPWNEPDKEDYPSSQPADTKPEILTAAAARPQAESIAQAAPQEQVPAPDAAFEGEEEFQNEFAQAFAESLVKETEPGEIITGRIVRIDADDVIVDVGFKSEGVIPRAEFVDARNEFHAQVGEEVRVLVQRRENKEGLMVLSKRQVDKRLGWEHAKAAMANGAAIEGVISGKCKGGFTVDLNGAQAFLPSSQLDLRTVVNPDEHLGKRYWFKILKFNQERGNILVSRRSYLIDERNQKRQEVVGTLAPGRLVRGVVKTITKFGAFVDLGGVDGLLRVEDMAWSRISNPRQIVKQGDEIEALVLSVDETGGKIALGLKQKSQDPWANLAAKYPIGSQVEAEVVSLTDFGAFLRLEEGVEGLLPISEMSWTKRLRHPQEVLKAGDRVRVKVLALDGAAKKVTLGLKQTEPDPYQLYIESHKVGETVPGEVKSLTNYGAFVELADGVSGLLHISDLSWDASVRQPGDTLKRGDRLQVKILEIQPDKKKISLGLKQLSTDPWGAAVHKFPIGTVVKVTVLRNTKIGSFVQIEPGVEALIHISQFEKAKGATDPELPSLGSEVEAKVIKVNVGEHKIGLSVRELLQDQEAAEIKKYLSPASKHGASLAEISGINFEELKKRITTPQEG